MRSMTRAFDQLPATNLTYEDYLEFPDDGLRYEILDGELEVSPAPAPRHQGVSLNLVVMLDGHVRERRLGRVYYAPIDVLLARNNVVQPDIIFVAAGRESIVTARAVEGPPDLAVEILSPWSVRRDRVTKARVYARLGVPHYWILGTEARVVETYEAEAGTYRLAGTHEGAARFRPSLFPDLEIDLGRVWD